MDKLTIAIAGIALLSGGYLFLKMRGKVKDMMGGGAITPRPLPSQPGPVQSQPIPSQGPINREIDFLARTIWGEARGEPLRGQEAVAHVVLNRVRDRGFPNTVEDVVTQGNGSQFNAWSPRDPNFVKLKNVTQDDAMFRQAIMVAQQAFNGLSQDPTNGAIIYFNPRVADNGFTRAIFGQVQEGRAQEIVIANHSFFPGAR